MMDEYPQGGPRDFGPPRDFGHREFHGNHRNPERFPVVAAEVMKLDEKVMFPIEDYPRYNFIGKMLGPQGTTLKGLQRSTKTKMSILGRGSTKDKKKEEELSKSEDEQHKHLKLPLHVLIEVKAPPAEAHRRMSAALKEVYKFMVPEVEEMPPGPMDHGGYDGFDAYDDGRAGGSGLQPFRGGGPPRGGPPRGGPPARGDGRPQRGGRGGGPRAPPLVDPYAPVAPFEGDYREGYAGEKRPAPPNGFQQKRFRDY